MTEDITLFSAEPVELTFDFEFTPAEITIKGKEELEQATEEAKQATQHNQETVNSAVSELTELVMSLINSASTDEETGSEEQEG